MKTDPPPGLITSSEAAKLAGVGRFRCWQLAAVGEMKAVQLPGYPLYLDEASVRAWAARRGVSAGAAPGGKKPKPKRPAPGSAGKKKAAAAS